MTDPMNNLKISLESADLTQTTTILSELAARWQKMPATVFVTTAIIPIVPGIGLYQTMLKIVEQKVEQKYDQAAALGSSTLSAIGLMALALALSTLLVPSLHRLTRRHAD